MHWGGGTPTYYTPDQLARVYAAFAERFTFTPDAEIGIEVDPRVTTPEHIDRLAALGFNRISMGVQDFTPEVQVAVNRVQSAEDTAALVARSRAAGFKSVNIDLIYGLPLQKPDSFRRTLETVATIRPDRLAVYSFAFVPWIKAHMKHLPADALPGAEQKLELLALTIDVLTGAGYRTIGMDHFALPDDELARALDTRTLHRNFMGYTVQSARDMLAVGISGIGDVQDAFVQNVKKLPDYHDALAAGRFPVERGYALDPDDRIRRRVITQLMCNLHLDVADTEHRFGIRFADYFANELAELAAPGSCIDDGLLTVAPDALDVTPLGRRFVRNVCMVFDRHLRDPREAPRPQFSRTV
jgi:oxygen-independent coproporphyrinogen-3 oxidase